MKKMWQEERKGDDDGMRWISEQVQMDGDDEVFWPMRVVEVS